MIYETVWTIIVVFQKNSAFPCNSDGTRLAKYLDCVIYADIYGFLENSKVNNWQSTWSIQKYIKYVVKH